MGNSNGKDKSEEIVDGGQLVPHGLYKGPQDWDTKSVRKFIIERKLAPFYKGLSDYDDNWDDVTLTTHNLPKNGEIKKTITALGAKELKRTGTLNSTGTNKGKEINSMKTLETQLYKGAVECPICFLYYPQNINHSRCCDQPICTECFVQIKRPENGTLGANNSPAVCPFCVEPNFGVCYKPPPFSNGIGSENVTLHTTIQNNNSSPSLSSTNTSFNTSSSDSKSRRKSVSHKDPEVVTSDWATRVVLQSARQPLSPRRLQNLNSPGNPRRFVPRPNPPTTIVPPSASTNSRRNLTPDADYSRYLAAMRMGTDLEELMVMEAIRLSLVEQEVAQRREREERDRSNNNSQEISTPITTGTEDETITSTSAQLSPREEIRLINRNDDQEISPPPPLITASENDG
ncbi:5780_t:CDS:2 [Entrophospora sp. SA101]|nr:5780_t:CDS:2 [Entrophospora sp. SA101]